MIGYIKIVLTDQPGIFALGSAVTMYAPGDPVPTGLQISETITAERYRVVTGEDDLHLARIVQKIAYNRYKLKVFARPSDNAGLLHSGRYIAVYLPDGSIHRGEVLEFDDKQAGSINARMIDINYIDTNPDNYGAEPVNNYLTHSAIAAKIAAGLLSQINTCKLTSSFSGVPFSWYTALRPINAFSEPQYPEEDAVNGLIKPNATVSQKLYSVTFYVNEAIKVQIEEKIAVYGHTSTAVHTLTFAGSSYTAIETPRIEITAIPEAVDLYRIDMVFKYLNNYILNY